jgi:ribose 5-phosphate isomerase B
VLPFALASDHAGFELKESIKVYLLSQKYQVIDCGCDSTASVDYPLFAKKIAVLVATGEALGILICGTGIGMSITANRFAGVRAALCHSADYAKLAKEHNNANIICLGARFTSKESAFNIIDTWISAEFLADRHSRRLLAIDSP